MPARTVYFDMTNVSAPELNTYIRKQLQAVKRKRALMAEDAENVGDSPGRRRPSEIKQSKVSGLGAAEPRRPDGSPRGE